jgi:hypothetical protein
MLQVIMSLEQGISSEELHKDAPDAPDIAREGPTQTKNDFWSPIMPSRYY